MDVIRSVRCEEDGNKQLAMHVNVESFSTSQQSQSLLREACEGALRESARAAGASLRIQISARQHSRSSMVAAGPGLANVGSVIVVSSGKGGVGKSTIAVNLAFALAKGGARVGLLDADIQGPSLPTMLTASAPAPAPAATTVGSGASAAGELPPPPQTLKSIVRNGKGLLEPPLLHDLVRCMSYGFVAPKTSRVRLSGGRSSPPGSSSGNGNDNGNGNTPASPQTPSSAAAIMRGPMVSSTLQQLVRLTAWGTLDYLVVDLPPGTGDVHITLAQTVPISTAVIVTTPQALSFADVSKGLDMFASLNVDPCALALNMSYFRAPDTGIVYRPFGDGQAPLRQLLAAHGEALTAAASNLFEFPLRAQVSAAGDSGRPFVLLPPSPPAPASVSPSPSTAASATTHQQEDAEESAAILDTYMRLARVAAEAAEKGAWLRDNAGGGGGGASATLRPFGAGGGASPSSLSPSPPLSGKKAPPHPVSPPPTMLTAQRSVAAKYAPERGGFIVRSVTAEGAREDIVSSRALRLACRCAACVSETTGEVQLDPRAVPPDVIPTRVVEQGNYALAIEWSDGHKTGIFTFAQIADLASAKKQGN